MRKTYYPKLKVTVYIQLSREAIVDKDKKSNLKEQLIHSSLLFHPLDRRQFYCTYTVFAVPVYFTDEEFELTVPLENSNNVRQVSSHIFDDSSLSYLSIINDEVRLPLNYETGNSEEPNIQISHEEELDISSPLPDPQSRQLEDYHDIRSAASSHERYTLSSLQSTNVRNVMSSESSEICVSGYRFSQGHDGRNYFDSSNWSSFSRCQGINSKSHNGNTTSAEDSRSSCDNRKPTLAIPIENGGSENQYPNSILQNQERRLENNRDEEAGVGEGISHNSKHATAISQYHHDTRPPDLYTTQMCLVHSKESSVTQGAGQKESRVRNDLDHVKRNLNQRVIQRMLQKGYFRVDIFMAAVYFYQTEGHCGISVSKLMQILESDFWPDVCRDISSKFSKEDL